MPCITYLFSKVFMSKEFDQLDCQGHERGYQQKYFMCFYEYQIKCDLRAADYKHNYSNVVGDFVCTLMRKLAVLSYESYDG